MRHGLHARTHMKGNDGSVAVLSHLCAEHPSDASTHHSHFACPLAQDQHAWSKGKMGNDSGSCRWSVAILLSHIGHRQIPYSQYFGSCPDPPELRSCSIQGVRVPFVLPLRVPGLAEPGTNSPPAFRASDYFRFHLHQGLFHP